MGSFRSAALEQVAAFDKQTLKPTTTEEKVVLPDQVGNDSFNLKGLRLLKLSSFYLDNHCPGEKPGCVRLRRGKPHRLRSFTGDSRGPPRAPPTSSRQGQFTLISHCFSLLLTVFGLGAQRRGELQQRPFPQQQHGLWRDRLLEGMGESGKSEDGGLVTLHLTPLSHAFCILADQWQWQTKKKKLISILT